MFIIAKCEHIKDVEYKLTNIRASEEPHGPTIDLNSLTGDRHHWGITLEQATDIHHADLSGKVYGEKSLPDGEVSLYVHVEDPAVWSQIEEAADLYLIKYHF